MLHAGRSSLSVQHDARGVYDILGSSTGHGSQEGNVDGLVTWVPAISGDAQARLQTRQVHCLQLAIVSMR
jgi:hypothetical protein